MCPEKIREEANKIIDNLHELVGEGASDWSLIIGGVKGRKRAKAKEIICRAKTLKHLIEERTSA